MRHYEMNLLKWATHKGYRIQNGIILNDFDLLAKLQHHGAATRLIDATRNMLVAVFFASNCNLNTYGALFGFHTDCLGGYEGEPKEGSYFDVVKGLDKYHHPQTWEPPVVSGRIAAQHSQFLYSAVSGSKKGSLWLDENEKALLTIALSPKLKEECMELLRNLFDLRDFTLFPDLDGFCHANGFGQDRYSIYRW